MFAAHSCLVSVYSSFLFIHPSILPPGHLSVHTFIHWSNQMYIYSCICSLIHPCICPAIHLICRSHHTYTHTAIPAFIYTSTIHPSYSQPLHLPSIYLGIIIQPPNQSPSSDSPVTLSSIHSPFSHVCLEGTTHAANEWLQVSLCQLLLGVPVSSCI